MNLPLHQIHDIAYSYSTLLLPTRHWDVHGNRRWLILTSKGVKLSHYYGFHNCTKTGCY